MNAQFTKREPATRRVYFPQLDGLRFIAYFLVLISHFGNPAAYFEQFPTLQFLLGKLRDFGWAGVDLFLVLSSFLIFSLLIEERQRTGTVAIKAFYIRRALRIWPVYYPYLIASFIVLPFVINLFLHEASYETTLRVHLLPFLTFTGNFSYGFSFSSVSLLFGHLWTVCLEEQFYLLPPLLVFFFALRFDRRMALTVCGLLAFSFAWRWYVVANGIPYPMVWVNPLCRMDPFVLGAAGALIVAYRPQWLSTPKTGLLLCAAAGLAFCVVASFPSIQFSWHAVWQLLLIDVGAACLVLATFSLPSMVRGLSWGPLPYLGKITFGLYVFHPPAVGAVKLLHLDAALGTAPLSYFLALGATVALNIAVAAASYYFYEAPILKYKAKFEVVRSRPV